MQIRTFYHVFTPYLLVLKFHFIVYDRSHQVGRVWTPKPTPNSGSAVGPSPHDILYCSVNPLPLQELQLRLLIPDQSAVLELNCNQFCHHKKLNGPGSCNSTRIRHCLIVIRNEPFTRYVHLQVKQALGKLESSHFKWSLGLNDPGMHHDMYITVILQEARQCNNFCPPPAQNVRRIWKILITINTP